MVRTTQVRGPESCESDAVLTTFDINIPTNQASLVSKSISCFSHTVWKLQEWIQSQKRGGRTTEQGIAETGWTPLTNQNKRVVNDDSAAGMVWGRPWRRKQTPLSRVFMNVF